jgi:hypothetical protein
VVATAATPLLESIAKSTVGLSPELLTGTQIENANSSSIRSRRLDI